MKYGLRTSIPLSLPVPTWTTSARTVSPTSRSRVASIATRSYCSRKRRVNSPIASTPTNTPDSGNVGGTTIITWGSSSATATRKSPVPHPSKMRRTISTFSSDIAYSDSPAASRASSLL